MTGSPTCAFLLNNNQMIMACARATTSLQPNTSKHYLLYPGCACLCAVPFRLLTRSLTPACTESTDAVAASNTLTRFPLRHPIPYHAFLRRKNPTSSSPSIQYSFNGLDARRKTQDARARRHGPMHGRLRE